MRASCIFLFVSCLFAQGPHQIQDIRFDGVGRTGADILSARLLIKTGKTYSDKQLEQAAARIARLPFIHNAYYELETAADGSVTLVIAVEENRMFTGQVGTSWSRWDGSGQTQSSDQFVARGTFFVGKSMAVGITARPDMTWTQEHESQSSYDVGLTHYNLFGTPFTATAGVEVQEDRNPDFFGNSYWYQYDNEPTWSFALELPFAGNNRVHGRYLSGGGDSEILASINGELWTQKDNFSAVGVGWEYSTANDELEPDSGMVISADVYSNKFKQDEVQGPSLPYSSERDHTTFTAGFKQYHPYRSRGVFYYEAAAGQVEDNFSYSDGSDTIVVPDRYDGRYVRAELGNRWHLWGDDLTSRVGDLRLTVAAFGMHSRLDGRDGDAEGTSYGGRAGLSLRNEWGRVNLGYQYTSFD